MVIFVDTSAFFALLDTSNHAHAAARRIWTTLDEDELVSTSYVLIETVSLLQRRLGFVGIDLFRQTLEPTIRIVWVDEALHRAGIAIWDAERRRQLSLVDCVSFACIARDGIDAAFAFDQHFTAQGIQLVT